MKKVQEEEEAYEKSGSTGEFISKVKEPSLTYCLIKIFAGKFLAGSFLKLIQDCKFIAFYFHFSTELIVIKSVFFCLLIFPF